MGIARIVAPFFVSALLFVLAYLSSKESSSGMFPLILLAFGLVLSVVGVAAVFSGNNEK